MDSSGYNPSNRPGKASTLVPFEISFECHGAVVLLIARRVNQGNRPLLTFLPQQIDSVLSLPQFLSVPLLELLPFGWVVSEPLAEFRARGHVL